MFLKSSGSVCINSINEKTCTQSSNIGKSVLLWNNLLNLFLHTLTSYFNSVNKTFSVNNFRDSLELKKSELISTKSNRSMLAFRGGIETFNLSPLSEYKIVRLSIETPEALTSCATPGLCSINNKSSIGLWCDSTELAQEFFAYNMAGGRLHWFNYNCGNWISWWYLSSKRWSDVLKNSWFVLPSRIGKSWPVQAGQLWGSSKTWKWERGMISMGGPRETKCWPFSWATFCHSSEDSFLYTLSSSCESNCWKSLGSIFIHRFMKKSLEILACNLICCQVRIN